MNPIASSAEMLIGHTPLVRLSRLCPDTCVLAKLELMNPAGSAKDRAALAMLNEAESSGRLKPGGTVIEPTSGNTGIALAMLCAIRGYRCVIVMPDTMSIERQQTIRAYGAQVLLTPGALGMSGAIEKARQLEKETENSIIAGQFDNPANVHAHYTATGPEIWADTQGAVDIFVAGVGTGGTLTGVGKYLKERNPQVEIVAVEPSNSPLLSAGIAGSHGLQGIGANFVPSILDTALIDRIITVTEENAYSAARLLAKKEGILAGISSGAALHAAMELAQQPENHGKTIVALLPDSGMRYLSTDLFCE